MMLGGKPGVSALFVATAAIGAAVLEVSSAATRTAPSADMPQVTRLRDPTPTMLQHTARVASGDEPRMKPDLRATAFSPQNAYFFAALSKLSYAKHSEVGGFLAGNSTSEGLGFDHFYWFTAGEEADKWRFDAIQDTEAFVAANDDMIVIVFRGTQGAADWATNVKLSWRSCPVEWNFPIPGGSVHEGFDDGVSSVWRSAGMYDTIKSLYYEQGKSRKLYLAGHSLGGALATIVAGRLAFGENMNIAAIYTIGSPRIFDYVSSKHFDEKMNHGIALKDKHFRVRNNNDIIARVPPFPYEHVGTEIYLDRFGVIGTPDFEDRLLGRLSNYGQGKFLDGVNDHRSAEYLRRLTQLALDWDFSPDFSPL